MSRIANRDADICIAKRMPFRGSNFYAVWVKGEHYDRYVVYSYGEHWPLYVFENGVWYEVNEKYSSTTTRHHNIARRGVNSNTTRMDPRRMRILANRGTMGLVMTPPGTLEFWGKVDILMEFFREQAETLQK